MHAKSNLNNDMTNYVKLPWVFALLGPWFENHNFDGFLVETF